MLLALAHMKLIKVAQTIYIRTEVVIFDCFAGS